MWTLSKYYSHKYGWINKTATAKQTFQCCELKEDKENNWTVFFNHCPWKYCTLEMYRLHQGNLIIITIFFFIFTTLSQNFHSSLTRLMWPPWSGTDHYILVLLGKVFLHLFYSFFVWPQNAQNILWPTFKSKWSLVWLSKCSLLDAWFPRSIIHDYRQHLIYNWTEQFFEFSIVWKWHPFHNNSTLNLDMF